MVRIHFPPAESPQTIGSCGDFILLGSGGLTELVEQQRGRDQNAVIISVPRMRRRFKLVFG